MCGKTPCEGVCSGLFEQPISLADVSATDTPTTGPAGERFPGQRLGLPAAGTGAIAGYGVRLGAFALDALVGGLIGRLVDTVLQLSTTSQWSAVTSTAAFAVEVAVLIAATGQSVGMRIVGLRVRPLSGAARPAPQWAVVRTLLLILLLPALVWDRDQRGLHDKAAGTVVVRA